MDMMKWAENEVHIACQREREASETPEEEWDYGCACYESALKAYKSLCGDEHSGMSFSITRGILERLMAGCPLTPIEDVPEVWEELPWDRGGFQCLRKSSLFKKVNGDGTVSYNDVERAYGINENGATYHSGLIDRIVDEMYPIQMPYCPASRGFAVHAEEFLSDRKNGDFDHVGIFYMIKPDGKREEINRFFDLTGEKDVEISEEEYRKRRAAAVQIG